MGDPLKVTCHEDEDERAEHTQTPTQRHAYTHDLCTSFKVTHICLSLSADADDSLLPQNMLCYIKGSKNIWMTLTYAFNNACNGDMFLSLCSNRQDLIKAVSFLALSLIGT